MVSKNGEEHSRVAKGNSSGVQRATTTNNNDGAGWLAVGAAALYIIISEGSRIAFPPRNFIPVP